MEFPRKGLYNNCDGYCVACDIIPAEIKEAVIILTLSILKGEFNPSDNSTPTKVKKMTFDKQSVEFAGSGAYLSGEGGCGGGIETVSSDPLCNVRHLLKCYMGNRFPSNARFIRGA